MVRWEVFCLFLFCGKACVRLVFLIPKRLERKNSLVKPSRPDTFFEGRFELEIQSLVVVRQLRFSICVCVFFAK